MLVVYPGLPANSLRELLAYLRANPGKVLFGSAGNGSTTQIAMELFKTMAGVDVVHVPYRGGGPALAGLPDGEVQMMIELTASSYPQVKAGKLKGLAVTTLARLGFTQIKPDEGKPSAGEFLHAASAHLDSLGVRVRRVLTDNGPRFRSTHTLRPGMQRPWHQTLAEPCLSASGQRQSRTLQPVGASRVGLLHPPRRFLGACQHARALDA